MKGRDKTKIRPLASGPCGLESGNLPWEVEPLGSGAVVSPWGISD